MTWSVCFARFPHPIPRAGRQWTTVRKNLGPHARYAGQAARVTKQSPPRWHPRRPSARLATALRRRANSVDRAMCEQSGSRASHGKSALDRNSGVKSAEIESNSVLEIRSKDKTTNGNRQITERTHTKDWGKR
ncbi:hypothetical protein MRX96_047445 [Rhipicephalus microplus]